MLDEEVRSKQEHIARAKHRPHVREELWVRGQTPNELLRFMEIGKPDLCDLLASARAACLTLVSQ